MAWSTMSLSTKYLALCTYNHHSHVAIEVVYFVVRLLTIHLPRKRLRVKVPNFPAQTFNLTG